MRNKLFSLLIMQEASYAHIDMYMHCGVVTTTVLPSTYRFLKVNLPSIYSSKCFNPQNIPFSKEVRSTEIGHLFEHILLEYLSMEKSSTGDTKTIYRGETAWDWTKEQVGTFHITITNTQDDIELLKKAVYRTINLLTKVLETPTKDSKKYFLPPTNDGIPAIW